MTGIHVIGDSHIGAMARGHCNLDAPATKIIMFHKLGTGGSLLESFFEVDESAGIVRIVKEKRRSLSFPVPNAKGERRRTGLYCVCLPFNMGRFLRYYNWATYVPWQFKKSASEIPISDALLERMIGGDVYQALAFTAALKKAGLDVCVAESPRYFKHAPHVKRTRQGVCTFLSEAYFGYVHKRLEALEIPVIAQRSETIGPDGETLAAFRRQKIDRTDNFHANAEFGAMMIEDLLAYAADCSGGTASAA